MSVFLKVEGLSNDTKLFHLKGIFHRFGEDSKGALTSHNPSKEIFKILSNKDSYLIQATSESLHLNGASLALNTCTKLLEDTTYYYNDYRFVFFFTDTLSELASNYTASQLEVLDSLDHFEYYLSLSAKLDRSELAVKEYPLFSGLVYSIGSATDNAITIENLNLKAHHLNITLSDKLCHCYAVQGGFLYNGQIQMQSLDLAIPSTIQFPLSNLELAINRRS